MLLVVFGAGASYDSVLHCPPPKPTGAGSQNWVTVVPDPVKPYEVLRPPLANQLFDNRPDFVRVMQIFGDCKPLVNLLRGNVRVEQKLAQLEEEAKTFPPRNRQLNAIKYYLHEMLWNCEERWKGEHRGITNHATFLDAIERWRFEKREKVCLLTFNYDTMIEQAMEEILGFKFDHFGRYIRDERYTLIKLHGSVDWGLEVLIPASPTDPRQVLEETAALLVSDRFRKVSPGVRFDDNTIGFPAIAIPVENKNQFMCPPEHLQALANVIPQITRIITIGWRGTEQHFLKMLRSPLTGLKSSVSLMVVSGDMTGVTETNSNLGLVDPGPGRRYSTVASGFSGLITNITELEKFLW